MSLFHMQRHLIHMLWEQGTALAVEAAVPKHTVPGAKCGASPGTRDPLCTGELTLRNRPKILTSSIVLDYVRTEQLV